MQSREEAGRKMIAAMGFYFSHIPRAIEGSVRKRRNEGKT